MSQVIFITGTGTGVGKTVLTALLLHHLRQRGCRALGVKPFCSGGRGDARLLLGLQKGAIDIDEVNPFYFPKPLAPWVADSGNSIKQNITIERVRSKLDPLTDRCETLLVEGSGGVCVPISPKLLVLDLVAEISDRVILAAPNALGTINHSLLTVKALRERGVKEFSVVLMGQKGADISAKTNAATLGHFLGGAPVVEIPYLGAQVSTITGVKRASIQLKHELDAILRF